MDELDAAGMALLTSVITGTCVFFATNGCTNDSWRKELVGKGLAEYNRESKWQWKAATRPQAEPGIPSLLKIGQPVVVLHADKSAWFEGPVTAFTEDGNMVKVGDRDYGWVTFDRLVPIATPEEVK